MVSDSSEDAIELSRTGVTSAEARGEEEAEPPFVVCRAVVRWVGGRSSGMVGSRVTQEELIGRLRIATRRPTIHLARRYLAIGCGQALR